MISVRKRELKCDDNAVIARVISIMGDHPFNIRDIGCFDGDIVLRDTERMPQSHVLLMKREMDTQLVMAGIVDVHVRCTITDELIKILPTEMDGNGMRVPFTFHVRSATDATTVVMCGTMSFDFTSTKRWWSKRRYDWTVKIRFTSAIIPNSSTPQTGIVYHTPSDLE